VVPARAAEVFGVGDSQALVGLVGLRIPTAAVRIGAVARAMASRDLLAALPTGVERMASVPMAATISARRAVRHSAGVTDLRMVPLDRRVLAAQWPTDNGILLGGPAEPLVSRAQAFRVPGTLQMVAHHPPACGTPGQPSRMANGTRLVPRAVSLLAGLLPALDLWGARRRPEVTPLRILTARG
jgi:hypothetical protein